MLAESLLESLSREDYATDIFGDLFSPRSSKSLIFFRDAWKDLDIFWQRFRYSLKVALEIIKTMCLIFSIDWLNITSSSIWLVHLKLKSFRSSGTNISMPYLPTPYHLGTHIEYYRKWYENRWFFILFFSIKNYFE